MVISLLGTSRVFCGLMLPDGQPLETCEEGTMRYSKPTVTVIGRAERVIECQAKALSWGWDARDFLLNLVFDFPAYEMDE